LGRQGSGGAVTQQQQQQQRSQYRRIGDLDARIDAQRVEWLLARRNDARRARDFEQADRIRSDLRGMGCFWDDNERTWSVGGAERTGRGHQGEPMGRAEDWKCPHCSNLNYHFRSVCNRCKAPRPDARAVPASGGSPPVPSRGGSEPAPDRAPLRADSLPDDQRSEDGQDSVRPSQLTPPWW
jgi:hypothetical protein